MRHYGLIFILFFFTNLYAEELPKTPSVSTLIEQVKSAKVENRRVLMNQLKVQLRKMNQESRHKVMRELKHSFSSKKEHSSNAQHRHRQKRNLHKQHTHQPKYRRLNNGSGRGNGQGHGGK